MNLFNLHKLSFRFASLGVLTLAILVSSANSSLAQYTTTLPTLSIPSGPVYVIPEPPISPVPAPPELMTVNIAGAVFLGAPFEVDMLEFFVGGQQLSDRILFDNLGPGGTALITFLSDDEFGNLPRRSDGSPFPFYPPHPLSGPEGPITITVPILDLTSTLTYPLTALMISDTEAALPPDPRLGNNSDLLALSIPEPSTVTMAGMGLAALAALAFRRRQTRLTA